MSRRGLAAALLLAALSARAQVEVRPTLVLPSAPAAFAPVPLALPSPALSASPLSAPAVLVPSLAPAAAAAAVPLAAPIPAAAAASQPSPVLAPAQAHAAAMTAALKDFSRLDLESAQAGEARDAGETLMLRALGGSAPESVAEPAVGAGSFLPPLAAPGPAGRREEPRVYLLSKPLHETVRFGPASIALHVVYSVLWELMKAAIAYKATGSLAAAATVFAFESMSSPVMITARSLGDLGQRYWRRKLAVLKELARAPGVARVKILTTGEVTFTGPLARRKDNMGLIFVEAEGELPGELGRFGAPIPLGDVASSRVRLSYVSDAGASATTWTPTLKDLLDGRPIPPEIAAAWRVESKGVKPALQKMLDVSKGKTRLEAALLGPGGSERAIGSIAEGPSARALIGLGLLDRARVALGWELPSRAIPLSDSAIERPGDARPAGIMAALRRAWRRLTGRLIVASTPR